VIHFSSGFIHCVSEFIAKAAANTFRRHFMFENYRTFETTYAGRKLVVETGKTCGL